MPGALVKVLNRKRKRKMKDNDALLISYQFSKPRVFLLSRFIREIQEDKIPQVFA